MIKNKSVILLAAVLASGCATESNQWSRFYNDAQVDWGRLKTFAPEKLILREGEGGLVFYRSNENLDRRAINIAIDGEYLTSLRPEGYSQVATCAKPTHITAEYTGATEDSSYAHKLALKGELVGVQSGIVTYFEVGSGQKGKPTLNLVPVEEAQEKLKAIKQNSYHLPRVDRQKNCSPTTYRLDVSALFAFDRSEGKDIVDDGYQKLVALAEEIKKNDDLHKIAVKGHTDPKGDALYNKKLSERRAVTVSNILAQNGLSSKQIQATGLGESQPLVTDCDIKYPHDQQAENTCNQPNRRVEVELSNN